jgi:enoyl-CoA hydratase/carnithine racemase
MSRELNEDFREALRLFEANDDAWVGILTGRGRGFCAGRDLKAQVASGAAPRPQYNAEFSIFGMPESDKPMVAAVNGYAIGQGWYMTIACDIRVAAASARFSMGEIPTGVLGPYWLASAEGLPWATAAEFALLGEQVPAQRLLELGLLNEVVADELLLDCAKKWARKLAAMPPVHVRRTKALMRAMRQTPSADLLRVEDATRAELNALEDTREAALAFAEKRPPRFTGR